MEDVLEHAIVEDVKSNDIVKETTLLNTMMQTQHHIDTLGTIHWGSEVRNQESGHAAGSSNNGLFNYFVA